MKLSDGLEMHCTIRGRAGAAPLLFVHGFPLSADLWEAVVDRLDPDRYLAIVPDLRGHGRTPSAPAGAAAPDELPMSQFARDLAELVDRLDQHQPVTLIGLSMGGYIIFEFYRRFRQRVRALVLANTRATPDTEEAARAREIQAFAVLRDGSRVVADAMMPKLFKPPPHADAQEVVNTWRERISSANPAAVAATLRGLARRPDSRPTLATIDIPTLIIAGAHDSITPPSDAQAMHAAIAGSRLVTIPDAAHMTPVEQPTMYTEVLVSFLNDHHIG